MNQFKQYYVYLFASLAFSIGVQMLLPYPYGLIIAIASFVVFPLIYRKAVLKMGRAGYADRVKMVKSCMVCGKKTGGDQCDRCGSRQFKMN